MTDECESPSPSAVIAASFSLLLCVDEIISLGYKENVTIAQIRSYVEMDSHEERLQKIVTDNKISEAKRLAQARAEEIEKTRQHMQESGYGNSYSGGGHDSSYGGHGRQDSSGYMSAPYQHENMAGGGLSSSGHSYGSASGGSSGVGSGSGSSGLGGISGAESKTPEPTRLVNKKPVKGMSLTKVTRKTDDFVSALKQEEKLDEAPLPQPTASHLGSGSTSINAGGIAEAQPAPVSTHAHIIIEEKVHVVLDRDGSAKSMDVMGQMKVLVFDPSDTKIAIKTNGALTQAWKPQLKPGLDKPRFVQQGVLALADESKAFTIGSEGNILVRWRQATAGTDANPPFLLNFWSNPENGRSVVSAEFFAEGDSPTVERVTIAIPCPSAGQAPVVNSVDGEARYDARARMLFWDVPAISGRGGAEGATRGALEFSVAEVDNQAFFPISLAFTASKPFSGISVEEIVQIGNDSTQSKFVEQVRVIADKCIVD